MTIKAADITALGIYDVQTNGNDTSYMRALTHRYVNGQLRFLTLTHTGQLQEFAIPSGFGQRATAKTGQWNLAAVTGDFSGLWWEEAKQRLWVTATVDYGNGDQYYPTRITTLTLGANGTIANVKTISLQGISAKHAYGGVQPVPADVQTRLGCGPYAVGFGGYTSLLLQTSKPALGPCLIAFPDPSGLTNGAEVPSSQFRVLLDTPPGERGVRKTIPINYFDGGDPRPNPDTPPTVAPLKSGSWLSPNSDGLGWMVWGDSYYNNAAWTDVGLLMIAALGKGKTWYQQSTLHFDDRQFELHVWDSAKIGGNVRQPPDDMRELVLPRGIVPQPWDGDVPTANISGVTFDATTRTLYAIGFPLGADVYTGRLYAFKVPAGGVVTPPAPTPVDAIVSAWSMASAGPWTPCVNGSQTRTETWTRTVAVPAKNGGGTPPLSETRTATQACTVTPPPPVGLVLPPGTQIILPPGSPVPAGTSQAGTVVKVN